MFFFFFSSRRRHTRCLSDWSSDVCSSDLLARAGDNGRARALMAHWPGRNEHWLIMAALVAVGDTAAALDRLERASPVPYLWAGLRRPEFDALHGNPRYERLLASLRPPGPWGS